METKTKMKKFTLERTDERDLSFTGKMIAKGKSSFDNCSPYFSGDDCRCQTVRIFKTKGGKYILHIFNNTRFFNEKDYFYAEPFDNEKDLIKALEVQVGLNWLGKEVLEEAGIEAVEFVE